MATISVDESLGQLKDLLGRAENWAVDLTSLPDSLADVVSRGSSCAQELRQLRTRATSTLISIAMFGTFSSGKSTLVSGLLGKLEVIEQVDRDGYPIEEFVGILPAAPEPANACPARISPVEDDSRVDAAGRGFLRVRFASQRGWEDIGSSPVPAMVAAYLTDWAERANRKAGHWYKEVAEAEILLSSPAVPARLYDLPGYGSPNREHDEVIKEAMNDADCFIYVTRANRTLSEEDLELIRVLYDHCRLGRKRVIWVLTGIDEAAHADYRHIPHWRRIIDQNNKYLDANFTINGRPDSSFIGDGFIGVSPVAEARTKALASTTGTNVTSDGKSRTSHRPTDSRMDTLRQVISNLVEMESGHKRIHDVAREVQAHVIPLNIALHARLREERTPVEEQAAALAKIRKSLERVESALASASKELAKILSNRVKRASRPFSELASLLHEQLDTLIRKTDIRSRSKANQIYVTKTQILQAWVTAPGGPAELWEKQLDEFQRDIVGWVRKHFKTEDMAPSLHTEPFDLDLLDFNITSVRKGTRPQTLQLAAGVVTVSSGIAAAAGWLISTTGLSVVFPPAAVIAGVAGAVVIGTEVFKRSRGKSSLTVMQDEWIADLDQETKVLQEQFEKSLNARGSQMIDSMSMTLESHRMQSQSAMERIQERIENPSYRTRQELVDQLEPPAAEGQRIVADLAGLIARCQ